MPNEAMRVTVTIHGQAPFDIQVGANAPADVRRAARRLIETAQKYPGIVVIRQTVIRADIMSADDIMTWLKNSRRLRSPDQIQGVPGRIVDALMTYPGLVPLACANFFHHYGACTCPELGTDRDEDGREYPERRYYRPWSLPIHSFPGWTVVKSELAGVDINRIPAGYGRKMSPATRGHLMALIAHVRAQMG